MNKKDENTVLTTNSLSMNQKKIQIETWSDIVCPFCFIGKKNLDNVIKELGISDQVEIIPRSFQLEPQFPKNNFEPSIKYLSEHKGYPESSVKAMCDDLTIQGRSMGIEFDFEAAKMFNTFDAHRLVKWARLFGLDTELNESLMVAYTCKGIDMSQRDNLLKLVASTGLDTTLATEMLKTTKYSSTISKDRELGLQLGLKGVPFYRVNEKYIISGVQSSKNIKQVLKTALSDVKMNPPMDEGSSCSLDGHCD